MRTDPLRALGMVASVGMDPESPLGLYVRGSSPDQNAFLLDGIPVNSVAHSSDAFSVFDGDVVERATLHAGAPSARLDAGVGGTVELTTATPTVARTTVSLTPSVVRVSTLQPISAWHGGISIAAARSY